jgi:hypothetical protein
LAVADPLVAEPAEAAISRPTSTSIVAYSQRTPIKRGLVITVHPFDQMLAEGAPRRIGSATER